MKSYNQSLATKGKDNHEMNRVAFGGGGWQICVLAIVSSSLWPKRLGRAKVLLKLKARKEKIHSHPNETTAKLNQRRVCAQVRETESESQYVT